jgi:transposase
MKRIVLKVRWSVKERLRKNLPKVRDARTRIRYLMIFNVLAGRSSRETAKVLKVHHTTVGRVVKRFERYGEAGLQDGRCDNGQDKLDEEFLQELDRVVRKSPQDFGWKRPTWTRESLVEVMVRRTGVRVHAATMSRALAAIKARRGQPKPRVLCPWAKGRKTRRLNALQKLIATLPRNERIFYEDEVDIHLNPKIGPDWMGHGQQKEVLTPGKNQKRYLAGALDVRSGVLTWVEGVHKTSYLFLDLLDKLRKKYPDAKVLHLILDNYRIHSSTIVLAALGGYLAGKVKLHFLPPYCPDHNKIERLWKDLHDNVTRNHRCRGINQLMQDVRYYLHKRNRRTLRQRLENLAA